MIKRAELTDADCLASLAIHMWAEHNLDGLTEEFREIINDENAACFLKYIDNIPIAFAQCHLRHDYVEGTNSSPVGYLEGIFVAEGYRSKGYASELLTECEKWAKEKGCSEFGSDCELDNSDSLRFHMAMALRKQTG